MRLSSPSLLVDINGVAGLDGISRQERHGRDRRADAPCHAGALFRHRETCAADRAGDAAHRASGDPQSRHHRRLARLCGPGRRTAGVPGGARRRDRYRRAEGQAHREGRRFLQGPVRDGARAARRAERGPLSGGDRGHARRLRRAGAAAWRLRDGRAGGCREGERQGLERRAALSISASAQRRCARARPRPRWRAARSTRPSRRSISIRPTTSRRPAR